MAKFIAKHRLDATHYIAEMDDPKCIVLVTTDKDGKAVRWVIFGMNTGEEKGE